MNLWGHGLCYQLFARQQFCLFGNKVFRQIVGIPMATLCASLVADMCLCCLNLRLCLSCKTRTRRKHSFISLFKNNCRYLNCQQSTWSDMRCIHYKGIYLIATCNNTTWSDMRGIHYNVMWPLRTWTNTTWSDVIRIETIFNRIKWTETKEEV